MSDNDNVNELQPDMNETFSSDSATVEQPEDFYEEPVNQPYKENDVMVPQYAYVRNDASMPIATVYSDVTSFLRVILSNLWLIILIGVIGTAISYFYISQQPQVYQSSASVVIAPSATSDDLTRVQADILRMSGMPLQGTYVQFLESRNIRDQAITGLEAQYSRDQLEDAEIDIIPVSNSAVIEVIVRSNSPELARDLANKVMEVGGTRSPEAYLTVYELDVLNPASLPSSPVAPAVATSTILGALGSLAVGVALAFLLDSYRQYRRNARG